MRRVAQETGLGRESLYKSMRSGASPEFGTVLKVLRALGFWLQVHPTRLDEIKNFHIEIQAGPVDGTQVKLSGLLTTGNSSGVICQVVSPALACHPSACLRKAGGTGMHRPLVASG